MHKPCPKSDQKDIDKASMKLTCPDLDKLSPLLKLGSYSAAAIDAVDRHNNDGGCDDDHHWHDKCTDVGIFCGIDLFGCNSIDDGLYRCSAIGDDPQLLKICGSSFPETCRLDENSLYYCKHAGSKPVWHEKCKEGKCPEGSSMCPKEPIDPDCLCQAAGTICGSLFPEKCNLDPEALYVCRNAGDVPKFLEEKSEGCNPRRDDCLCKEKGDVSQGM
ncbi:hypothetical protein BGX28_000572 [Mortierella sp. GBA30]|nr:hypothetical protein BGX28_000572 [Mortierella sp. GBA30]